MTTPQDNKLMPGVELDALVAERPYRCRACGNTGFKLMSGKRCCYPCHRAHGEKWRKANPEKHNKKYRTVEGRARFSEYRKEWALKTRYGISLSDYKRMVLSQGGVCLICNGNQSATRPLVVDHCHKTGIVRGPLCDPCNIGLSNFRENPTSLFRAIEYLAALRAVEHE